MTPDADVTLALGVGEGIELALSLRRLPGCEPSRLGALSANQLAAFPLLAGLETLWLAIDNDPAGIAAAAEVRARWRRAGREVVSVKAKTRRRRPERRRPAPPDRPTPRSHGPSR